MKKAALLTLVSALLLVCFFSLSAAAGGNAEDNSESSPQIVSKNLSYASYLYVCYAIPTESVPDGSTLTVDFYESDPATCEAAYTVDKVYVDTIRAITGEDAQYYVVASRGISPKHATRTLWAVPVATDAEGVRTEGEAVPYSVAEYCYERLAADGFINESGDSYYNTLRRDLYLATLSYIHCSQVAFSTECEGLALLSELSYLASRDSSYGGKTQGFVDAGTLYTVTETGGKPEGYTFIGWDITSFGIDGVVTHSTSSLTSYGAKLEGSTAMLVEASYRKTPEVERAEQIAAQDKLDEEEKARQWEALEDAFVTKKGYTEENAKDLTDALKTLYTLYGDEMVTWVASLYAKGFNDIESGRWAGGFYASTAGRDAAGYGPDLQCTVQLLRFLQQSGVISSVKTDIPEWMAQQMIYFAKSLQDPNGYYYHPQWGKAFTDTKISRRGRDLGWGNSLLAFWGESPVYDTPNGVKGDGETADDYLERIGLNKDGTPIAAVTSLSASIATSKACAVSRAMTVSDTDSTDSSTAYLKSHTAFIDYLLTYVEPGMKTSPYSTGNTLNATNGQIGNYSSILGVYTYIEGDESATAGALASDYKQFDGMTMRDMLFKVLDDTVNPNTGLFGGYDEASGTYLGMESINFSNTNGFFKVIGIYNGKSRAYPNAALAAVGLISNLTNPDLPSTGNACDVYNVWNALGSLKSNKAAKETVFALESGGNLMMCEESTPGAVSMTVAEFINKTLELRGADAVRITYDKIKGYKKSDGAFSHSYTGGVSNHQGCPVSPSGANVSDVDATCISSTGLTRSIFTAFGMGSYKSDFFGKADYMRFIDYIEAADPVYKSSIEDVTDRFDGGERQNSITGDAEASDGYLTVSGDTEILRSPYATKGSATVLYINVLFSEGSHTATFLTKGGALVALDLLATKDSLKITNRHTGSYVNLQTNGKYIDLSFEWRFEGEGITLYIIGSNTVLFEETLFGAAIPEKLTEISSVKLTTSSEISVDTLVFATVTPSYELKGSDGRISFDNLGIGEYDHSKYTKLITFSNATYGDNASRALIVAEGNNKFLRLEDNWSNGSITAQNYFDFKREAGACDTVIFEARMRITTTHTGVIPISVLNSSGGAAYYGAMKISGGYVYANVANSKNDRTKDMTKTSVKAGEWFFVRLEYTAEDVYNESFICKIYVNDVLIDSESAEQDGLVYSSSSNIVRFRMACDTAWHGKLDYDMVFVGTDKTYTPPVISDEGDGSHVHVPAPAATENLTDYTCDADGKCELVTYCEDADCGAEISRVYVNLPASHRPGEITVENQKDSSCTLDGSYDEVSYCTECGEEASRVTVRIPASHAEGEEVEENRKESTCTLSGSYDRVIYCTECEEELRRITVIIAPAHTESAPYDVPKTEPTCTATGSYERVVDCAVCGEELLREERIIATKPHSIVSGVCTECGGSDFIIDGVIDFEDIEAKVIIPADKAANVNTGSNSTIDTAVYAKTPSKGIATAEIVSEGENKYIKLDRFDNTTATNTWIDVFRDTSRDADLICFESRLKLSAVNTGGGLYVRLYKGRTPSASGTRLTYHTVSRSGDYLVYAGAKTHLKYDEWGTVRITFEATDSGYLYTFLAKNETGAAITFGGRSYADGEFIPYFTTASLEKDATLDSLSEVSAITFMQSTASIATLCLDDVYFGASPSYVTKK